MVSFLNEIYHSVAETLPDFRDEGFDEEAADVETTVEVVGGSDPYAECLNNKVQSAVAKPKAKAKGKGLRKIRKMSKSVSINLVRKTGGSAGMEERWLPPGRMKDMWELYVRRMAPSVVKPASFTTFWRESWIRTLV